MLQLNWLIKTSTCEIIFVNVVASSERATEYRSSRCCDETEHFAKIQTTWYSLSAFRCFGPARIEPS